MLSIIVTLLLASCKNVDSRETNTTQPPAAPPTPEPWEAGPTVPVFPDRTEKVRDIAPGVQLSIVHVTGTGPGLPLRLFVYLPKGKHEAKSLPCVFIAPAGADYWGMEINATDIPEQTPYAQAGFAVVAYEVGGALPPEVQAHLSWEGLKPCVTEFMRCDGGLVNGKIAIDYALARLPEVDPARLYSCGHSSAAEQALDLCRGDSRIQACCAYAPPLDLIKNWGADDQTEKVFPGFRAFTERRSSLLHVADFKKPLFIFHADDDKSKCTLKECQVFVDELNAAHQPVTFQRVGTGGHYQSMIDRGIPAGIKFLTELGAKPLAPDFGTNP